jgi:hypothetical protein
MNPNFDKLELDAIMLENEWLRDEILVWEKLGKTKEELFFIYEKLSSS